MESKPKGIRLSQDAVYITLNMDFIWRSKTKWNFKNIGFI